MSKVSKWYVGVRDLRAAPVEFKRHQLRHQDDLYSLDPDTLSTLKPVHALIFLFKYVGGDDAVEAAGFEVDPMDTGVWFANQVRTIPCTPPAYLKLTGQVINNSCGTLAALNAVMNIKPQPSSFPDEAIELGVSCTLLYP